MAEIKLRVYQGDSIDAVFSYWAQGGGNPLIDMATGLGKSVVVAKINRDILARYPKMRILNLVHVQELVEQNFTALIRLWPDAPAGVYSAGLGRRDAHHRIAFASIQSVFRRARELGPRDLILIDEAHLVPKSGEGMYRTLIEALREQTPDMRVMGLTATAYRLDSGRLDTGDDRLFDEIVYTYGVGEGIEDGWLAPLTCRAAEVEIDVSSVGKRGGEFISGALEAAADTDELVRATAFEIAERGKERRSWLCFCSGVKHAQHVAEALQELGYEAAFVTGETPKDERRRLIADFRSGKLRALTNAQVLTTGFDAPQTDLIAFLRPTLSTGLYVQMIGRGTRPVYPPGFDPNAATKEERIAAIASSSKPNCLVLDFSGNVRRHGPVDAVYVRDKKKRGGKDEEEEFKVKEESVRAKPCPACGSLQPIAVTICRDCGAEFPSREPKHDRHADLEAVVLARDLPKPSAQEAQVFSWQVKEHKKWLNGDLSVRVTYYAGLQRVEEYIAFGRAGFAGRKAGEWWREHGGELPLPANVPEALSRWGELTMPSSIFVQPDGQWLRVTGRRFADRKENA